MKRALLAFAGCFASCVGPTDDASQVKDLRVLAVSFEPPELMAPQCDPSAPSTFLIFGAPVKATWLIVDPAGGGRELDYEVTVCAHQGDTRCDNDGDFKQLAAGKTQAGELTLTLNPGATFVDDGPLLAEVAAQDSYRGFGGIRMPVMLHLKGGDEEVFAQKLMVFSCRFFPGMKQNVSPQLPGMLFADGGVWAEDEVAQFSRTSDAGVTLVPAPFEELQETYVVPSFELKPLTLTEAWKISYHSDRGRFSPLQTGGVDFDGFEGKHKTEWRPLSTEKDETDVQFWFVVRDGRGGQTWILRKAHWKP